MSNSNNTNSEKSEHDETAQDQQPATVRAEFSHATGPFDDPSHAWFLLFISIIAIVSQLCIRILHEDKPAASRTQTQTSKSAVEDANGGVDAIVTQKMPNSAVQDVNGGVSAIVAQTLAEPAAVNVRSAGHLVGDGDAPSTCGPFDEECHARVLEYSEAVSYGADSGVFYTELKDWVLYMIFFVSLYAFSYVGLRRYQRRRRTSSVYSSQTPPHENGQTHKAEGSRRHGHARGAAAAAPGQVRDAPSWSDEDSAAHEDDALPFALCSLSVAVALGSVLLVPMTIVDGLLRKYLAAEVSARVRVRVTCGGNSRCISGCG